MTIDQRIAFLKGGMFLVAFVLPLAIVFLATRFLKWRSRLARFCLSVPTTWLAVDYFQATFLSPLAIHVPKGSSDMFLERGLGFIILLIGFGIPTLVVLVAFSMEDSPRTGSPSSHASR